MNSILKNLVRLNSIKAVLNPAAKMILGRKPQIQLMARNVCYMSKMNMQQQNQHNLFCSCGFGNRKFAHTTSEKELVEFLTEEILAERKAQKVKTIPTEIDGFKANLNGAEITLTKKTDTESIKIIFNVNHSVDTEAEGEFNENMDNKPDIGELKSTPAFRVDLSRENTTVSVSCSFVPPNEQDDDDGFAIDELSIYNGEWNENVYSVSGEVLDSYLYDLLINYLTEKGITNEFVDKLSNYSTAYEHSAYIGLLEGLSKFISVK